MADDFVVVNRAKQHGNNTVRIADLLRELRELIDKEMDAFDHMNNGVTYATAETQFGLPSGAGANFGTLLGNLRDILNTSVEVTGANRLARLDEFVGRLAGQ